MRQGVVLWVQSSGVSPDGAFNLLFSFGPSSGSTPLAPLIQDANGDLYGTTFQGPMAFPNMNLGSVFKFTAGGEFHSLVSFHGPDGANPYGGLALDHDGNLYGTTFYGGSSNLGVVFQVSSNGLTALASFTGVNGAHPVAGLTQGKDENFYGTTWGGGEYNAGTVFRITPGGALTGLFQ
jgi:uncharacterized repeat protein (TIGR03803 family)